MECTRVKEESEGREEIGKGREGEIGEGEWEGGDE